MAFTIWPTTPSGKAILRQYIAALTATLGLMVVGESFGWPSPTLPKLMEPGAPFTINHTQISWMVSLLYLGNMISPIPTGYLMDKFGRKRSLLYINVFSITSWILILIAKSPVMLYIARFFAGIWIGSVTTVVPLYIGEIAQPNIRGALANFVSMMTYFGDLFVYVIGPYVSYSSLAIIAGLVPVLFAVTFSMMPETPYFYVMHKQTDEARKSLSWLRGDKNKDELEAELIQIDHTVTKQMENKGRFQDIFATRGSRKAFLIVEMLSIFLKFSGTGVIMAFASTTLPKNAFKSLGPNECVIFLGLTWVLSAIVSSILVDKLGRKILLTVSSMGCGVAMLFAGLWFYYDQETNVDVSQINWVPFTTFIMHGVLYSLGLGPIGMGIKGEMFTANIKALTSAITSIVLALSSMILNKVYLILADTVGMYVNYWIFSISCFMAALFTIFVVVETKGKTLQQILDELNEKKTLRKIQILDDIDL
uniref:Major facilitator superfamily (MFS) profile domain-containing protein n=1 Tax=Clastoptera arizonana TaxID=38151 RepID=A0A1B6DV63_9HEMI